MLPVLCDGNWREVIPNISDLSVGFGSFSAADLGNLSVGFGEIIADGHC